MADLELMSGRAASTRGRARARAPLLRRATTCSPRRTTAPVRLEDHLQDVVKLPLASYIAVTAPRRRRRRQGPRHRRGLCRQAAPPLGRSSARPQRRVLLPERLLAISCSRRPSGRAGGARPSSRPNLLSVLDDDAARPGRCSSCSPISTTSLARFALTNSAPPPVERCALLVPELKTFGLRAGDPGCGYGEALAASTLRLQPDEVLDFARFWRWNVVRRRREHNRRRSSRGATRSSSAGADDPRVAGQVVALPRTTLTSDFFLASLRHFFCPPFAYVPFEDATEDDAPQIAADFCDFATRCRRDARRLFGFSVVEHAGGDDGQLGDGAGGQGRLPHDVPLRAARPAGEDFSDLARAHRRRRRRRAVVGRQRHAAGVATRRDGSQARPSPRRATSPEGPPPLTIFSTSRARGGARGGGGGRARRRRGGGRRRLAVRLNREDLDTTR